MNADILIRDMFVHTHANQLLLQLLMDRFDTLPSQYRYFGHLHVEQFEFQNNSYCTDRMTVFSTELIFLYILNGLCWCYDGEKSEIKGTRFKFIF